MSQPIDPNSSAPKQPDEQPRDFGAGAFEAAVEPTKPETNARDAAPIQLEAMALPPVIELPAPAAVPEPATIFATPAESQEPNAAATISEAPRAELHVAPVPPAEPARAAEPGHEMLVASEPGANVKEVEAVPVTRFDAPAPTIDVEARRAPPPSEPPAPEHFAPRAPEPIAAGASFAAAAGASTGAATLPPMPGDPGASRWWSMCCHLLLFLAIPTLFLGGLFTFVVWQLAGRRDALVTAHGREALNFQINVAAITALLAITCIGSPLIPVVWFVAGVFCILAAVRAFSGESYRYPFMLRIVRG